MDPLSDILTVLRPRDHSAAGFDMGRDWCLAFSSEPNAIKCLALSKGECWLDVEGTEELTRISVGDCILLPHGRAFRVGSDLALDAIPAEHYFLDASPGRVTLHRGGGFTAGFAAHFTFPGQHSRMLLDGLPLVVHLHRESHKANQRWSLERMMEELLNPEPGGTLMLEQLSRMLLIQALRLYMKRGSGRVGWLFALADKRLAAAIAALHAEPSKAWTLPLLAKCAGMSRTVFALRFKEKVGQSPMDYLTRWRMVLAGEQLVRSSTSIAEIAYSLGYESKTAFSAAFKRTMGTAPSRYRKP